MKLQLTTLGAEIIENSAEPDFFVDNDTFVKLTQDRNFALKVLQEIQSDSIVVGSLGTQHNDVYVDDSKIVYPDLDNKVFKKSSFGYFQKLE